MRTNKSFLCALALAGLLFACKAGKTGTAAKTTAATTCATTPLYNSDIKPLIDKHCALSCHSAKNSAGGIELASYESLSAEARKARFMGALRHKLPYAPMPKKAAQLSDSTLKVLDCWIAGGLPQ